MPPQYLSSAARGSSEGGSEGTQKEGQLMYLSQISITTITIKNPGLQTSTSMANATFLDFYEVVIGQLTPLNLDAHKCCLNVTQSLH